MAEDHRPHVLVAAYACHPDRGSEPGAGWQWVRAIAQRHDVTLLTGQDRDDRLETEVARLALSVDVIRIMTPADRIGRDSRWRYLRYGMWLAAAACRAARLESSTEFVVAHHLTYASDWLPSPLAALRRTPFVWGPVGGATYSRAGIDDGAPMRSRLVDMVREGVGRLSRRTLAASTVERAGLIVALNKDTASAFSGRPLVIEPNAALEYEVFPPITPPTATSNGTKRAVCAGRLLPWKGVRLALLALSEQRCAGWTLDVFGEGSDRGDLEKFTRNLGISQRVTFHGNIPRTDLLASLSQADAFIFPSLHDSAPWVVAEAAAVGVPILCFDAGAATMLAGPCARLIDTREPSSSIAALLDDIRVEPQARTPHREFSADRLVDRAEAWYRIVNPDNYFIQQF